MAVVLTISELSARSGVAASALRYYESRGLIHAERTTGNRRRFARPTLRRLAFIRAAQRVGLSLDEIGEALAGLPVDRTPTKRDWQRLSRGWRERLDRQLERLEHLRDDLDGCIGCGCLSLRSCALYNPADALAGLGAGGVRLDPDLRPLADGASAASRS